jgi:hypothetical protein
MRLLSHLGLAVVVGLASAVPFASAQEVPPAPVLPGSPLPVPQVLPSPSPAVLPVRPLTLDEFAASFKPLPGQYEVLLVHPKTCCPVKVCFTLPPGCLRGMRVSKHKIVFDYKCQHDVVIRFLPFGKVWVRG